MRKSGMFVLLALATNFWFVPGTKAQTNANSVPSNSGPVTNQIVDANEVFNQIEAAVGDLSKANQEKIFSISSAGSDNLNDVFIDIVQKVELLKGKYKVAKGENPKLVNARELYKEIELSLSAKDLAAMDTIHSLKYKKGINTAGYSPDPSQCANHCQRTCGYDGVGNKVCWFTCYYCCGHGGC
jgi:hypothetical protein